MADRKPTVSVCVPTYNGAAYLAECIGSILTQSFSDYEVVVCDDQSSDDTLGLARELAKGDERFRFISNPNRLGLVQNWNNCVAQARGEWIKFVFQDDVIFPSCIESLLAACEKHVKVFGFCERDFIFEEGIPREICNWFIEHNDELHRKYWTRPVITPAEAIRAAVREPEYNMVGEPTVTLIKRSVFEEIGCFDEEFIQFCDAEFWFRVITAYGAAFVPKRLAAFRVHPRAASARNHETRAYRTSVLDPLILRYRFAFGRQFAHLRNPRVTGKSNLQLRLECAPLASRAWRLAKMLQLADNQSNEQPMAEWKSTVSRYPGLQIMRLMGHLRNFVHRIELILQGKAR
jgi:glycosyltransferase involved in cell wall biosynthesis